MIKTRFAKLKILFLSLFLLTISAHAQTTAFTYQGRLNDSSLPQPTNGTYDFLFKIFDAGGVQQGGQIQVSNVAVQNGIFTVQLDFGTVLISPAGVQFLEIAVRPAGPQGAYTVLSPRQPITSAPAAVQALNAASAVDSQKLGGVNADQFVQILDPRLSDARQPLPGSASYIQNTNSLQTANFNISGGGKIGGSLTVTSIADIGASIFVGGDANITSSLTANQINSNTQYNLGGSRVLSRQGTNNLFIGFSAGQNISTGKNNVFAGSFAGQNNTTANDSAFYGAFAGLNSNSSFNSFFGSEAGMANTSGNQNSFFGYQAGKSNVSGGGNAFFGENAGSSNVSGFNNAFFGTQSGNKVTGSNNSFLGSAAGNIATSAFNNVLIGFNTGSTQTTEDNNTLVGFDADINVGVSFSTALGSGAKATLSHTIVLGTSAETVVIPNLGAAGATQLCRNAQNQIATCSSSARYKTNIASFNSGLNIVKRLQPVAFNWRADNRADFGLVAEDVAKIEPLLATYNEAGEVEGVKYDRVGVVLLNAVKEQQAQIERQNEVIEKQAEQLRQQQAQLDALKKLVCAEKPETELCREKR